MQDSRLTADRTSKVSTKRFGCKTPLSIRFALFGTVIALTILAYTLAPTIGLRGQAMIGLITFLALAAVLSTDLKAVNLKTLGWGIAIQVLLAIAVTRSIHVQSFFPWIGYSIKVLIDCSNHGSEFVFGSLSDSSGPAGFIFAFKSLLPIIFLSSFFSVLYSFGVLRGSCNS